MKNCCNCQDENFCYYPGGAPSNNCCDNWSPSDKYKAQQYDEYFSTGTSCMGKVMNLSQEACSQCKDLEKCVTTAVIHPKSEIRCIHFGYIKKVTEDCINNAIMKIAKSLITYPEEN